MHWLWLRFLWLFSWCVFRIILLWPGSVLVPPFIWLLPWAGTYAYTEGGFNDFRKWWPLRKQGVTPYEVSEGHHA